MNFFKKYIFTLTLVILLSTFFLPQSVKASEKISSFDSNIKVNKDNSITVEETIVYDSDGLEKHGIYRDIDKMSAQMRMMNIEVQSVTDDKENNIFFTTTESNSTLSIKIGDPDTVFQGKKTYKIKYVATQATSQFPEFSEIYWNVTGNSWKFPIEKVSSTIMLPEGAVVQQSRCYFGVRGSVEECSIKQNVESVIANHSVILNEGEGFTVAVGFQKGLLQAYEPPSAFTVWFEKYYEIINLSTLVFLPLLTFIFSYKRWYKKGRDEKGKGVITTQFDVPDNLTPLEVDAIVYERISKKAFSAEIIRLASLGYLKIGVIRPRRFLGIPISKTDYVFIKNNDYSQIKDEPIKTYEKNLISSIFLYRQKVTLSELNKHNKLFKIFEKITDEVCQTVFDNGYFSAIGKMNFSFDKKIKAYQKSHKNVTIDANLPRSFLGWFSVFCLLNFSLTLILDILFLGFGNFGITLSLSLIFSQLVLLGFFFLSPARTKEGALTRECLLGLKRYISMAETRRIEFHNAPEKTPEHFEKLLPYAIVFNSTKIWAKSFETVYTKQPSWYEGDSPFNPYTFGIGFSSISISTPMPKGSGSGGGGFSGGGGGGGGGGSW